MIKNFFRICLLTAMVSCTNAQVHKLNSIDFKDSISSNKNIQLIDVRTPEEVSGGFIAGATNINYNASDFNQQVEKLDKSKPVYVYCLSGGRSNAAANQLVKKGYVVYELAGGIMDWRANKMGEVKQTTSQDMSLEEYMQLINKTGEYVLVDFYAPWCGPCKKMKPYLEKFDTEKPNNIEIIRINVDEYPNLSTELKIKAIPVLMLYRNGKLVWENIGFIDEDGVRKVLSKY